MDPTSPNQSLINYSVSGIVIAMNYLSVPEAAAIIGVTDRRVRAMIANGLLAAERIGGRWLLPDTQVDRMAAAPRKPGRPYSPAHAWGLLAIAADRATPWLADRDRRRLSETLSSTTIEDLAPALRRRAELRPWFVHPGVLTDFTADDRTVAAGPSATSRLSYNGPTHLYVSASATDALLSEYRPITDAADPNVIVRIVHGVWPFTEGESVAWPVVVAVDLLEERSDVRARRVAHEILESSHA